MNEKENITLVRGLGLAGLSAAIFNCTVGGGIFRLPGLVYEMGGAWTPIVYLLCGFLILCAGFCFALIGRQTLKTGGPYAYVAQAFGPFPGFIAGILAWTLGTFSMAAVANALVDSFSAIIPALATSMIRAGILGAFLVLLVQANLRGIKSGARILSVITIAKLLPLAALLVFGLPEVGLGTIALHEPFDPQRFTRTAMMLIFAFLGIESALIPSGEIRDPQKTVPISLAIGLVGVTLLYFLIQIASQAVLGKALAQNAEAPLIAVAGALFGQPGKWLLVIGASLSMFGFLMSMTLAMPRVLYAFAERGLFPAFLGRIHPISRVPTAAIVTQSSLVFALAFSGTFETLAILANVSAIILYILCIAASWTVSGRMEIGAPNMPPRGLIHAVTTVSIATMIWLLTSVSAKEWGYLVVAAGLSTVLYGTLRFKSRGQASG